MPASFLLAFLAAGLLPAGNPVVGKCQGAHRPGDRIVCYVTFKGDADFTSLSLGFNPEAVQDPGELPIAFNLEKSRKIAPGTYEVSDTLPFATSGRCHLVSIIAGRGPGVYRMYNYGREFFNRITIHFTDETVEETPPDLNVNLNEPQISVPLQSMVPHLKPGMIKSKPLPASKIKPGKEKKEKLVEIGPPPSGPGPNLFPQFRSLRGRNWKRPCEGGHTPGSKITCYVSFSGPSAFTSLYLSFATPQVQSDQSGLCSSFMLQNSRKTNRRTYRVSGVLPPCAGGSYLLTDMVARTLTGMRSYMEGVDFINKFPAIRLDNYNQTVFPDILTIGAELPPQD